MLLQLCVVLAKSPRFVQKRTNYLPDTGGNLMNPDGPSCCPQVDDVDPHDSYNNNHLVFFVEEWKNNENIFSSIRWKIIDLWRLFPVVKVIKVIYLSITTIVPKTEISSACEVVLLVMWSLTHIYIKSTCYSKNCKLMTRVHTGSSFLPLAWIK